ncbi:uncharacterized protein LOC143039417 [Oratosquilla oratoria]|uniref:uncharacterized protein LOC143039417 n=1 Tax=Oratosquilla oratoria TaxID=337810 RepID=UPI003F7691D5
MGCAQGALLAGLLFLLANGWAVPKPTSEVFLQSVDFDGGGGGGGYWDPGADPVFPLGQEDLFLRKTRKHARPMFYINCAYRDMCHCYSKVTRHHYCCSCDVGACFPGHSLVSTPSGTPIPMHALRTGDIVLTATSEGQLVGTKVLGFLDRRPGETSLYLALHTDTGHVISLSPNHVIFRQKSHNASDASAARHVASDLVDDVFGSEVAPGDRVFADNGRGQLVAATVLFVDHFLAKGAYVPLTMEGTLLVDGVVVSCYASYGHDLAHSFLTPVRLMPSLLHPGAALAHRGLDLLQKWFLTCPAWPFRSLVSAWQYLREFEGDCKDKEKGEEDGSLEYELEGEAYYVSLVKIIGRVMYSDQRAPQTVHTVDTNPSVTLRYFFDSPGLTHISYLLSLLLPRTW